MTPAEKKAAFAAKQRASTKQNPFWGPQGVFGKAPRVPRRANAKAAQNKRVADHIDGFDRDDLGDSHD